MLPKYKRLNRQEAVAAWLEQLRAPEPLKTTGQLEDIVNSNRRCCLGHACHALEMERGTGIKGSYGTEVSFLPKELCTLLGINKVGEFKNPIQLEDRGNCNVYSSLVSVNDKSTLRPAQIADVIESEFLNDNFVTRDL